MVSQDTIIHVLRAHSGYLAQEFGVRRLGLFGSFTQGHAIEASDVDLVVELESPIGLRFIELGDYLEKLLGRRVDLLTPAGLQAIRQKSVARAIADSIVYVWGTHHGHHRTQASN
jgi:predicted nucleotidyltransferase